MKNRRWLWVMMILSLPIALLISFAFGLAVGYAVLGKESFDEVFQWVTWKHVWDLVFAP